MRCFLLAVVAGLAVLAVQIRADEASLGEDINLTDEQMATMLADLFDDDDFAAALEEQTSRREARARGEDPKASEAEEKAANIEPKDQARYNNFIDTFLRRLNSYSRTRFDPLQVGLSKKGRSGGSPSKNKGKKKKNSSKKTKKSTKKSKKNKNGKKSSRHPKDLDLEDVEEEHEAVPVEEAEEEVHEISKREVELEVFEITEEEEEEEGELDEEDDEVEEESLVRVTRDVEAEAEGEDVGRRGKPAPGGKKKSPKGKKSNKGARKGGKKKKGNKKPKSGKKGKKTGKKGGGKKSKRSAKKSGSQARTSRATVAGISTLRRIGDVVVANKGSGKEMRAKFSMGPVELRMSRKFGRGNAAVQRDARAVSPEINGKLSILVAQNGRAKITNFHVARPSIVQVDGTLHKTEKGKSDNNLIENSLGRATPFVSKKLKLASREILSAGDGKSSSDPES